MDTLLLIDGNAIMHRAFHALPPFQTKDGTQTNILYGFLGILLKAIEDFTPTHIIVAFDTPTPTFRKKLHKEYQSHRPDLVDDFKVQIPILRQMLRDADITTLEKPGFEADDVIGTIVARFKKNARILILTGDKDIMQLVDKNVTVVTPKVGVSSVNVYGIDEVKQKLGVVPSMIPELKGLMGDPSDNYKGAKGIGPKTAVKLLEQFGSIEKMLAHPEKIENERIMNLIKEHADSIRMSKKLATIVTDVPVECDIEMTRFKGFPPKLARFLDRYEIHSLAARIFSSKKQKPDEPSKEKKEDAVDQGKLF